MLSQDQIIDLRLRTDQFGPEYFHISFTSRALNGAKIQREILKNVRSAYFTGVSTFRGTGIDVYDAEDHDDYGWINFQLDSIACYIEWHEGQSCGVSLRCSKLYEGEDALDGTLGTDADYMSPTFWVEPARLIRELLKESAQ